MNGRLTASAWFDVWMDTVSAVASGRQRIGIGRTLAREYCVVTAGERHGPTGGECAATMFDALFEGTANLSVRKPQ